jgi:hypothetical protein
MEDHVQKLAKAVALVAGLGLAATTALPAQNPAMPRHEPGAMGGMSDRMDREMQGMMQEMQAMMHDMMGIHAYGPDMLLDRKTELKLTTDQVKKLEDLSAEVKSAKDHAKTEHDVRHARVIEQFKQAKPDPAKVKADGQEAMNDMAAAHGVELSAAARAKGLLSDAQRTQVDAWMADHAKMMKEEHPRH